MQTEIDKLNSLKKELAEQNTIVDSLKIVNNSCFGKFGSKYSYLYSPQLLLQVTLTGQLYLLMLIERLERCGIPVISANTDGIVSKIPIEKLEIYENIVSEWENDTRMEMEFTRYKALYSHSVNNYIAVKESGCKLKGAYANPWSDPEQAIFRFHKNPVNLICIEAVVNLITKNIPIEQTIYDCDDIFKFITIRSDKNGASKGGNYLGKTIRWYYSKNDYRVIQSYNTNNKVPLSDSAVPCQTITGTITESIFDDLDHEYYIELANEILFDIDYVEPPKQLKLF